MDRFLAILNFKQFFFKAIDFANYGSAKHNSTKARAEGARDSNILFFKFWLEDEVPVFRYKYFESDSDLMFLPEPTKPPIKVRISSSGVLRSDTHCSCSKTLSSRLPRS